MTKTFPLVKVKLAAAGWNLGAFALLFCTTVSLQWLDGAFASEFGNHPDEAAHYVTGLMVRDYCWSGNWLHPRAYAEEYYVHYPKVALGHWPPFFYLLQGIWMSVFPIGRISLVLFLAVLTTSVATVVHQEVRRLYGRWAGLSAGLLFLLLPLVQQAAAALMADILMALLCLQAIRAYGRFLEQPRWQDASAFGVWSSLAIMTKGSGLALALLPATALLFRRRFDLLRRGTFWLPAVLVAILCAPWYFLTLGMVQSGWFESELSWSYFLNALRFYSFGMVGALGGGFFALAVLGLFAQLLLPFWRGGASGRWSAFGGWLVAFFAFQCLVPCGVEDRFLLTVLPILVIAVAAGAELVLRFISGLGSRPLPRLLGVFALSVLFLVFLNPLPKAEVVAGYSSVASEILGDRDGSGLVVLVSADPCGEGMFVSEIAQRDRRHAHVVLRTSKVLSSSHWVGKDFVLRFASEEEVSRFLENLSVDYIVLEMTAPLEKQSPDQRQLLTCLRSAKSPYRLSGTFDLLRRNKVFPEGIYVYRRQSIGSSSPRTVRVPMDTMLGKTLEVTLPPGSGRDPS